MNSPQIRPPKVLIVEDDARCALALMRSFRESNSSVFFEVDISEDVSSALTYIDRDAIDIYVVDLELPDKSQYGLSVENGKKLISRISNRTNAGILVHSDSELDDEGEESLSLGADDYLEKSAKPEIVRAQTLALWRRVKMTRQEANRRLVHTGRTFRIREWRFVIGERIVTSQTDQGVRLSPTEHAFLSYLCTVDDHEIDRREFNEAILNRPAHKRDQRIDNLVYRIRQKLGDCLLLTSKTEGTYQLTDVTELRAK
jgi:DNA-binding response OmpR family regulator